MGIPNMHTTIDYAKLIELQAKSCEERVATPNDVSHGKVKKMCMQQKKQMRNVRK